MSDDDFLEFMELASLLTRADTLPWNASVYFPPEGPTALDTRCGVIRDEISTYGEPDLHPAAEREGLVESLHVGDVQSIIENARLQIGKPSLAQLLEALQYYEENGAFIVLGSESR